MAKRILLFLGIAVILGCSGTSSLIVRNLKGESISGTMEMQRTFSREKPRRTTVEFSVADGQDAETLHWFANPPDWIDLKYGTPPVTKRFLAADYPRGMATGTSGGANYYLEVRDGGATLRDPTAWENFKRNPQTYFLVYGGWACCAATVIAMFWIPLRHIRKRRSSKRGTTIKSPTD